jgi:hypothetical protein
MQTITKKTIRRASRIIRENGYIVRIIDKNYATVEGGRLPFRVGVKRLLGAGDANPKTAKNRVPTKGLSLFPHRGIGFGNVCPFAKNCVATCLAHQGQGSVPSVYGARVAKTVLYHLAKDWFLLKLHRELDNFRRSRPADEIVGVRLNMFSDIPWEEHGIIDAHPGISYYDYSKDPNRFGMIRPNYWVTFSHDGLNTEDSLRVLRAGGNVSVVWHTAAADLLARFGTSAACGKAAHRQILPKTWNGFDVIDGGETDWRWEDPRGVVVGLRLLAKDYKSRNRAIASRFSPVVNASLPILGE